MFHGAILKLGLTRKYLIYFVYNWSGLSSKAYLLTAYEGKKLLSQFKLKVIWVYILNNLLG